MRIESEVGCGEFCSNESTFVTDDLAQCLCCVSFVIRCAFDVNLDVGISRRPTEHGFSGIPVRFLSLPWERRASLEKTLSLRAMGEWDAVAIIHMARLGKRSARKQFLETVEVDLLKLKRKF